MSELLKKFEDYQMGIIHLYELEDCIRAYNMSTDCSTARLVVGYKSELFLIIK